MQAAHVDTVSEVLRTLPDQHCAAFAEAVPSIIASAVAANATPDELARSLTKVARDLENDDGVSRHEQQRRDTSLRTWTDKRTGMFRLSGRFDPLSGALLYGRLQATLAALYVRCIQRALFSAAACPSNSRSRIT